MGSGVALRWSRLYEAAMDTRCGQRAAALDGLVWHRANGLCSAVGGVLKVDLRVGATWLAGVLCVCVCVCVCVFSVTCALFASSGDGGGGNRMMGTCAFSKCRFIGVGGSCIAREWRRVSCEFFVYRPRESRPASRCWLRTPCRPG